MDNIIANIFQENNHVLNESTDFILFSLKDKFNYWLVINRDDLTTVLEEQSDLFLKAKKIIGVPQFDKNANLLILYKVASISNIDKENLLQVEEDLYHFKKCIIYYTEEEFVKLKAKVDDSTIISDLEGMILNEAVFEKHKNNFDNNDYESLLYRLAHKIPFLKINVTQVNNLDSLEEINKTLILDNKLNSLLEKDYFALADEDFDAISDDNIFQTLKTILNNENQ